MNFKDSLFKHYGFTESDWRETISRFEPREYLSLTGSFDHNIVDGAPAARFMNQFLETVKSGRYLRVEF